jgi:hypothetical protein
MTKPILIALIMLTTLNAESLTEAQKTKLNTPIVKEQNKTLMIEEYNRVTFTEPILFEQQKVTELIIKTYATMPIETIHKEQFVAMSSSLSDQMTQSVLFTPQFAPYLKSSELLVSKPTKSEDLTIELIFNVDGINGKIYSKTKNVTNCISYEDMFQMNLK